MSESKTFEQGFSEGYSAAKVDAKEPRLSTGTACILVKDKELSNPDAPFFLWLKEKGFSKWQAGHGYYESVCWVFVNLNSKLFNPGMPGIKLTDVICDHAVTIDEFKLIYGIFEKYIGKKPLEF